MCNKIQTIGVVKIGLASHLFYKHLLIGLRAGKKNIMAGRAGRNSQSPNQRVGGSRAGQGRQEIGRKLRHRKKMKIIQLLNFALKYWFSNSGANKDQLWWIFFHHIYTKPSVPDFDSTGVEQGSAHLFCKGPDSKCVRISWPYMDSVTTSQFCIVV